MKRFCLVMTGLPVLLLMSACTPGSRVETAALSAEESSEMESSAIASWEEKERPAESSLTEIPAEGNAASDQAWETNEAVRDFSSYKQYVLKAQTENGTETQMADPSGKQSDELLFLPKLTLYTDQKTFSFSYDLLSSYLARGTYERSGNELRMDTDDGKYQYVFIVQDNGNLRFCQEDSSEIPQIRQEFGAAVTDGSEFEWIGSPATLDEVAELVGMDDEEAAGCLGGSEENWSNGFYIGRIYRIQLDDQSYSVYTSCDEQKTVASVTVWIVNGDRDVTDQETETWLSQLNRLMKTEPSFDGTSSEAGSQNWNWQGKETAASMNRMKDILTIGFQRVDEKYTLEK